MTTKARRDLTFKHNKDKGRHGWLRLTPAYSIKVVQEILDAHPEISYVLDPFSGTGTTGLVSAERGLRCDLIDINPFLVWFGRVKTANYTNEQLHCVRELAREIVARSRTEQCPLWVPPIRDIERWWSDEALNALARLYKAINDTIEGSSPVKDLLLVAFCRCIIEWSNAAFNHQSMSFRNSQPRLFEDDDNLLVQYGSTVSSVVQSAVHDLPGQVQIYNVDSRTMRAPEHGLYHAVITSPPYPNRMSYIRELRPYMYWLGYLTEAREAGELDWKAIGGTWGIATSRVAQWQPNGITVEVAEFGETVTAIARNSQLLANYVHKYFADVVEHVQSLFPHIESGGRVFYIVGNSKFYDTMVHVENIYADILRLNGFLEVEVKKIRKRNSKKELWEFIVSGRKP